MSAAPSLDRALFAELMAALGPFEPSPTLAVAVSGGADSMALILLADEWARQQGGQAVALTVDHRLRPESAEEAKQVGRWLGGRGIPHHILIWAEPQGGRDLQAAARRARYRLLGDWCRDHHILHLLLAHHQDDQAETLLLRLGRGSGVDGLAAMAPLTFTPDLQILRPLLKLPRDSLRAFLQGLGQDWIEDPSNQSDRFQRVRWRKILAAQPIPPARLALTAAQMGRARAALEHDQAQLAAEAVELDQAGFAWLDPAKLRAAPLEIALRLLAGLTRCVGGQEFPPRLDGLERLWASVAAGLGRRRSFHGCVLAPKGERILVHREARALQPPVPLIRGHWVRWDNRFSVKIAEKGDYRLGALGEEGAGLVRDYAEKRGIPRSVLSTMPAIMDKHGILSVPPLGYRAVGKVPAIAGWGFAPTIPLAAAGSRLVLAPARPM